MYRNKRRRGSGERKRYGGVLEEKKLANGDAKGEKDKEKRYK